MDPWPSATRIREALLKTTLSKKQLHRITRERVRDLLKYLRFSLGHRQVPDLGTEGGDR